MTTIHSLHQSLTNMSDEQAMILLRKVRKDRFIVPARRIEVVKSKRAETASSNKRIVNVLQAMSQEDRDKLIKMLEES